MARPDPTCRRSDGGDLSTGETFLASMDTSSGIDILRLAHNATGQQASGFARAVRTARIVVQAPSVCNPANGGRRLIHATSAV